MDRSDWGDDEAEPVRPPLPPEDRLWRHPSELGLGVTAGFTPVATRRPGRGALVVVAVAAGLLLVVATGAAIRYLGDTPSMAAGPDDGSEVSVVATSTATSLRSGASGWLQVVATLQSGKERISRAVVIDRNTVVTTMSAVAGSTSLAALLPDGHRLAARVLGDDDEAGIAVLGVEGQALNPDTMGSVVPLRVGDRVWMAGDGQPGEIVALGRHTASAGGARLHHVMRLEIDEMKAQEGQPLLDADGEVVGLCTRDMRGDVVGIPIDLATSAARTLRHNARLLLPWIGVSGRDAEPDARAGYPDGGALLATVVGDGPAATAGLAPGDVVIALGGTPVRTISSLVLAARAYDAGDAVPVEIVRDGQATTLTLVLGELPS